MLVLRHSRWVQEYIPILDWSVKLDASKQTLMNFQETKTEVPRKPFSFPGSVLQKAHKRRPILEERWRKPQQSFQFFSWYLFPIKKYPMLLHLHLLQGETRYSDNAQTHRYRSSFTRNWTTLVKKKKKGILVCWVASISYFVYWVSLWFW